MFVTNLTNAKLGVDGIIQLVANEQNRYIEETPDLVARVNRLKRAQLVTVSFDEGLVKPEPSEDVVAKPVEAVAVKTAEAEKPTAIEALKETESEPAAADSKPAGKGKGKLK